MGLDNGYVRPSSGATPGLKFCMQTASTAVCVVNVSAPTPPACPNSS